MKATKLLNSFLKAIFLCSILLIASCATIPDNTNRQAQRESFLKSANTVAFQARSVLKHNGSVYHFNLSWQQQDNSFNANGFDFLGRSLFQISGDQEQALFRHDEQEVAQSSRAVIAQQLGIDAVPLTLLHLLMGLTEEGFALTRERGLLSRQKSGTIDIVYNAYQDTGNYPMPSTVTITTSDASLKMALHSWQIQ